MTKETNTIKSAAVSSHLNRAALPLFSLALPMVLESFFRILVSSVDTLMLSSYAQNAVAAVGLISQFIFLLHIIFSMIGIGTSIVLSQYLGAHREDDCRKVVQASIMMMVLVSAVLSIALALSAHLILSAYTLEPDVRHFAWQYLVIFGGFGSIFTAFNMLQGTVLRSYGYSRDAMYISFAANIVNVAGNAVALYGPFGLPVLGVPGVAASSVLSQIVACALLASRIQKKQDIHFSLRGWKEVPKSFHAKILSIGVPTAGEALAYNISQILIMGFITSIGTAAMSSHVYTQTILRFVFVTAAATGNAVQIKIGYFVGGGQAETAWRRLWNYQAAGTAISLFLVLAINLFKHPIIGVFTTDPEIARLTAAMLTVAILVEFFRSVNLITIPALKGSGDVRYPVMWGMISMWGISVPGSFFFGLVLGWGMPGIWLAFALDEGIRALAMVWRWKRKRWMTKAIA